LGLLVFLLRLQDEALLQGLSESASEETASDRHINNILR
jgi:hypothetical protein